MTFGSLFAGIGGIDLGLERAGMHCEWQVEIDDYARQVLAKHWPSVRRWRDVRTFPPEPAKAWRCDLVCGGFPCQDISNAGRKVGIDGKRSGLWSEFARILGIVQPRYVLVENVPALTLRGLHRVLGDLAQLGFDAEWDRIPAASVGAPHRRWRLFIVAYAQGVQWEKVQRSQSDGASEPLAANPNGSGLEMPQQIRAGERHADNGRKETLSNSNGSLRERPNDSVRAGRNRPGGSHNQTLPNAPGRWSGQRWRDEFQAFCESQRNLFWPDPEPWLRRMDDGISPTLDRVPNRANRLKCIGNSVLPQVAEWIGRRIMEVNSNG
jgi:DNA (cytosine-5)-methyltransferase 1